jgi:DNA-binding response OmpR family regulator
MRILLVDDEQELTSALAERLEMRGIETDWVTTAEEALQKVTSTSYHLAVLDMRMPVMGGLELKALLQAKDPQLKFIFVTGYGSEKDFEKVACQDGEDCYLVKPVDINLLIQRMRDLLDPPGGDA